MVSVQDVRNAYRIILGRDAENDDVLHAHAAVSANLTDLWLRFLRSDEFARRSRSEAFGREELNVVPPDAPPMSVELEVGGDVAQRLLDRVHDQWARLGEAAPHWSVLTSDRYKPESIERNLTSFYDSGAADVAGFRWAMTRNNIDAGRITSCLEFGCGVGRLTAALAGMFRNVTAVDISGPHLSEAQAHLARSGVSTVQFVRLQRVDQLQELGRFDAVVSLIVLQHNPPPIIARLFRDLLSVLAPAGVAYIQIATYCTGYRFDTQRYLATSPAEGMEVHFIPQREVFRIIRDSDCDVVEVRDDPFLGRSNAWQSNTLLIRKRPKIGGDASGIAE